MEHIEAMLMLCQAFACATVRRAGSLEETFLDSRPKLLAASLLAET